MSSIAIDPNMASSGDSTRNLNESPLITVSGGAIADSILGSLAGQITSDLGRESIDWHRSYDKSLSVYMEANLVKLDPEKHLLSEQMLSPKYATSHLTASSASFTSSHKRAASGVQHHPTLSSATAHSSAPLVKRNHSFNVIRRTDSSVLGRHTSSPAKEFPSSTNSGSSLQSEGSSFATSPPNHAHGASSPEEQVNHPLVKLIGTRFLRTNGAQVLLNSYWIDAAQDLESYNATVREPLLDWFARLLANTAASLRLGLATEFALDCAIVIVCRSEIGKKATAASLAAPGGRPGTPTKSSEQILSLDRLGEGRQQSVLEQITGTPQKSNTASSLFKSSFGLSSSKNKVFGKSPAPSTGSPLSSALSSSLTSLPNATHGHLHGAASTNQLISPAALPPAQLTVSQLIDQMRNDLTVSYQLFQQKQFTAGQFELSSSAGTPPTVAAIASQIMERVLIFDYVSGHVGEAGGSTLGPPSGPAVPAGPSGNVSTMKQLSSALSNFGSGSGIKITGPASMMSPSKSAGKPRGGGPAVPESTSLPVLTYHSLVGRLRSLLLDGYGRHAEAYERLIRRQRELRNKGDWDFFGFFLLQEELALVYENLGLYGKALVQYDELDALFSQSILNTNAAGGIGPAWLQRRLLAEPPDEQADHRESLPGPLGSSEYSSLYSSWNGLCLCNPQAINTLRSRIVACVLVEEDTEDLAESEGETESDSAFYHSLTGTASSGPYSLGLDDPLGVSGRLGGGGGSPNKSSAAPRLSSSSMAPGPGSASGQLSLLDFRNYLFARQCHLLCLLNKPWELASRALPFLQTTVSELNLLDISIAPGGIACWVFLSVLEILYKCERYSDSSQLESYSYHTVGLWAYARDKLAELGKLCNLMPGATAASKLNSSVHLHRMVELVAGMGADPHTSGRSGTSEESQMSPQERLKTALSSSADFLRNYLEITELTMGTYKHIGYIRSARLIGKELAELYLKLCKPQQALPFLLDHYNLFQTEQWSVLKYEAARLLAQCLEALYLSVNAPAKDTPDDGDDSTEAAFNLEATIRSAFRTNLLLLLIRAQNQSLQSSESSSERDKYLGALRTLLETYSRNGLALRQIAEKLVNRKLSVGGGATPFGRHLAHPLLTIHNSQSDLFYDAYPASSTLTLANSTTSLHRLHSSSSATSKGGKLAGSEASLLGTSPPQPGAGGIGSSSVPSIVQAASSPQQVTPSNSTASQPRKLGEHFFQIVSVELSASSESALSGDPNTVQNVHRSDRSFIAGSRLQMSLQIVSELSLTLPVESLLVTLATRPDSGPTPASLRKKSSASLSSTSATSSEALDGTVGVAEPEPGYSTSDSHPRSLMVSYSGPSGTGMLCRNIDYLLKHPIRNEGGGSTLQFLPQLPVSLLNQRLADDQNNFRHYRFLGSSHTFDLLQTECTKSHSLVLKPGLNTYQLTFQSPDQFNVGPGDPSGSAHLKTSSQTSSTQANQLWFHFDQLVLLCRQPVEPTGEESTGESPTSASQVFAIVEDFSGLHSSDSGPLSTNFRLVKCPPTVELVPQIGAIEDSPINGELLNVATPAGGSASSLTSRPSVGYSTLLIGVDQLVTLRLNSGTNILPRGLKCFLKMIPIVPFSAAPPTFDVSSTDSGSTSSSLSAFDYRLVTVTLHPAEPVPSVKDDSVLYFYLDRQIEPFETFELSLKLRSAYTRPQVCAINQWAGHGVSAGVTVNSSASSLLTSGKSGPSLSSRDFQLTVSWTSTLDSPSGTPMQSVSAVAAFTLSQPYHLYSKLHTAGRKKLIEVAIRGAPDLANSLSLLRLRPPSLSHYHYSHNNSRAPIEEGSPASISFKPMAPSVTPICLKPNGEQHYLWEVMTPNEGCLTSLKRFMLNISYQDQSGSQTGAQTGESWQMVQYEVRLPADLSTRYLIRQFIEPMIGQKSTELLRVGNSCLFRATIEKVLTPTGDAQTAEDSPEDTEEQIMYELVYDSELWSLVSSYRSFETTGPSQQQQQQQVSLPPLGSLTSGSDFASMTSTATLGGSSSDGSASLHSGHSGHSGPESIRSNVSNIEFNVPSKVLVLTPAEPLFEANFEMMPLLDGYIPLPSIRLSRYLTPSEELGGRPPSPSPSSNAEPGRSDISDGSAHSKPSELKTTIESLSSLSKNWTQKLLSSSSGNTVGSPKSSQNREGATVAPTPSKTGRLVAFEPGQVYNHNRASQIYVLPAAQLSSFMSSEPGSGPLDSTAPASLLSMVS